MGHGKHSDRKHSSKGSRHRQSGTHRPNNSRNISSSEGDNTTQSNQRTTDGSNTGSLAMANWTPMYSSLQYQTQPGGSYPSSLLSPTRGGIGGTQASGSTGTPMQNSYQGGIYSPLQYETRPGGSYSSSSFSPSGGIGGTRASGSTSTGSLMQNYNQGSGYQYQQYGQPTIPSVMTPGQILSSQPPGAAADFHWECGPSEPWSDWETCCAIIFQRRLQATHLNVFSPENPIQTNYVFDRVYAELVVYFRQFNINFNRPMESVGQRLRQVRDEVYRWPQGIGVSENDCELPGFQTHTFEVKPGRMLPLPAPLEPYNPVGWMKTPTGTFLFTELEDLLLASFSRYTSRHPSKTWIQFYASVRDEMLEYLTQRNAPTFARTAECVQARGEPLRARPQDMQLWHTRKVLVDRDPALAAKLLDYHCKTYQLLFPSQDGPAGSFC